MATVDQQTARQIMGKNMFGIEEAIRHFGIEPSDEQQTFLSDISIPQEVLEVWKDSCVLAAVFPMSILDIRSYVESRQRGVFAVQDWYERKVFAQDEGWLAWRLVQKVSVQSHPSMTNGFELKHSAFPRAQVMTYVTIGHFLATNERLFPTKFIRCNDVHSDDRSVYVGHFDEHGFRIDSYRGNEFHNNFGVASGWKP